MEKSIFIAKTLRYRVLVRHLSTPHFVALLCLSLGLGVSALSASAQTETPPAPGAPKSGTIPAVQEKKLSNGLTVAVVERKSVPLVTIQLLIKAGARLDIRDDHRNMTPIEAASSNNHREIVAILRAAGERQ